MDGRTRRTRFEKRVDLEREFLTHINEAFGEVAPLAGMTAAAIDAWQTRASSCVGHEVVEPIRDLLFEISIRAELIADHSRDVFHRDGKWGPESIDDLRALLAKALERASAAEARRRGLVARA
ncbi:hypothetical protein [Pseudolabrys sp. Root1462]|uniref:hypothetical protein n=1 Tax=Pseudolabrys sp. Root1462 TaxID=1736466 RepID=UPI0012E3CC2B|nr:hypothetical protein [Pseudolabrys sp. Root1462]